MQFTTDVLGAAVMRGSHGETDVSAIVPSPCRTNGGWSLPGLFQFKVKLEISSRLEITKKVSRCPAGTRQGGDGD